MTHAELLRRDAELAMREGGMYYSGEYLSRMAIIAESLEAENAKLRELCGEMLLYIAYPYVCVRPSVLVERARELGVEVDG